MHVWFRQFAQQMGMQNTRAILPEQIDMVINASISDTLNQLVKENVGLTNDRVITDNSKIGSVNALRTLYRVEKLSLLPTEYTKDGVNKHYCYLRLDTRNTTPACFTNENRGNLIDSRGYKYYADSAKKIEIDSTGYYRNFPEYLYIVDFSLSYCRANRGWKSESSSTQAQEESHSPITNYFPVRLIDDKFLADTLNDFILRPRLRAPVIVTHDDGVFELYVDDMKEYFSSDGKSNGYVLTEHLIPRTLRFSYIAKPAKVCYRSDLTGNLSDNVDCDLPDYMHIDILKHAVDLWRIATSGALNAAQQQGQAQHQEMARNNYRNEGQ